MSCARLVRFLNGNKRNGGAGSLNVRSAVLDVVSPFLDITAPRLRPVRRVSWHCAWGVVTHRANISCSPTGQIALASMDGNDKALFDGLVDVRARHGCLVGWLLTPRVVSCRSCWCARAPPSRRTYLACEATTRTPSTRCHRTWCART